MSGTRVMEALATSGASAATPAPASLTRQAAATDDPERAAARERLVVFGTAALVLLVAIVTITPWPVGAFQDDAIYTILAKALATGEGYRMIDMPGAPNATHYPPGYPLVLAVLWKIWPQFPQNVTLFKFANAFFLSMAAVGTYVYVRSRFKAPVAASAVAAIAGTISIVILLITGVVLSEPLFMALLLPTLIACERAVDRQSPYAALIAGLLIGALAMVRTVGVFVLPAAVFVFLVRRQWRSIGTVIAGSAIFLVPWQLWVGKYQGDIAHPLIGKYGSYGSWLVEGYKRGGFSFAQAVVAKNVAEADNTFSFMIMPMQLRWPRLVLVLALLAFMALGTRRHWRNAPVSLLFIAGYMLVIMLWPFEPSRFILAIWPLWLPLIACGVLACWQWKLPNVASMAWRSVVAVLVVALVSGTTYYNVWGYSARWWVSIQKNTGERAKPTIEWVARYTQPNDVISTEDDLLVYLYTGRKTVPPATFTALERVYPIEDAEQVDALKGIFAAYQPRYLLVGGPSAVRAAALMAKSTPPLLKPLGSNPSVLIYERLAR